MTDLVANKVAVVTGAGSGIGRASALAFVREGAKVVLGDIDDAGGAETVKLVEQAGGEAVFSHCDISQEADVEALIAAGVAAFGRIDCAHNNAGAPGEGFSIVNDTVQLRGESERCLAIDEARSPTNDSPGRRRCHCHHGFLRRAGRYSQ